LAPQPSDFKRREEDRISRLNAEPTIAETDPDTGIQRLIYSCPVDHSGTTVYVKGWRNSQSSRPPLLLVHDVAENVGHYRAFAMQLCDAKSSVYGFDLRGHGRSGRRVGHVPRFAALVNDLLQVAAWVRHRESSVAPILIAQGFGAVLASEFRRAHPRFCSGLVLAAPSMDFVRPPGSPRTFFISALAEILPTLRLPAALCPRLSDPIAPTDTDLRSRIMEALSPAHQHRLTAAFAREILGAIERSEATFLDIDCPTLLMLPGKDDFFSYESLRNLVAVHPGKERMTIESYDELNHHVLGDSTPGRDKIANRILEWIDSVFPAGHRSSASASTAQSEASS